MQYCGLICEYNPFHTGHLYQLKEINKVFGEGAIVCAMSGSFVQRAEPAIINKNLRAQAALTGGAGAVIQIPTAHTLCGGEKFAQSALTILSGIKGLNHLAFGCETKNTQLLETMAKIQTCENPLFKETLQQSLNNGLPYTKALVSATLGICQNLGYNQDECKKILDGPNNVLAIEYLKTIYKNNYDITPIFIHRVNNYNSETITKQKFASATAIRAAILQGQVQSVAKFIPQFLDLPAEKTTDYKLFGQLLLFSIRTLQPEQLCQLADCAEGIENKLRKNSLIYTDINEVLEKTKSKRYTYARLKRLAVQALFGITKEISSDTSYPYAKLIGIRKKLQPHLSDFGSNIIIKHSDMPDITNKNFRKILNIDCLADDIHSLLSNTSANRFFTDKLLVVD